MQLLSPKVRQCGAWGLSVTSLEIKMPEKINGREPEMSEDDIQREELGRAVCRARKARPK